MHRQASHSPSTSAPSLPRRTTCSTLRRQPVPATRRSKTRRTGSMWTATPRPGASTRTLVPSRYREPGGTTRHSRWSIRPTSTRGETDSTKQAKTGPRASTLRFVDPISRRLYASGRSMPRKSMSVSNNSFPRPARSFKRGVDRKEKSLGLTHQSKGSVARSPRRKVTTNSN